MQTVLDHLYDIAESQAGYFTTAEAGNLGVSRQELYHLRRRGDVRAGGSRHPAACPVSVEPE